MGNLRISIALNHITAKRTRGETQRVTASLREAPYHSAASAVETETKASYTSRVSSGLFRQQNEICIQHEHGSEGDRPDRLREKAQT